MTMKTGVMMMMRVLLAVRTLPVALLSIIICTGKVFALFNENLQAAQKAKEEEERLKAEVYKLKPEEKEVCKREIKPEYVPTEATIRQLFSVQQVNYIMECNFLTINTFMLTTQCTEIM